MICQIVAGWSKIICFLYSEGLKKRLSRLPLYVQVPHMLLTLRPYHKMQVILVKTIAEE
jgi:hypothetical protein